jgi:hypothetical protein
METLELIITRRWFSAKSTIGEMFEAAGDFLGFTLEDPVRHGPDGILQASEKLPRETAIGPGRYRLILSFSERFKQVMPLLVGVDHYKGVRIHPLNGPHQTEGCVGIGQTRGIDFIGSSQIAYAHLCGRICTALNAGKQVYVTIKGEPDVKFWSPAA